MKPLVIIFLLIMGFYWLFDHYAPLPLNHEHFGLYSHSIHRIIGVVCFVLAGILAQVWKNKSA